MRNKLKEGGGIDSYQPTVLSESELDSLNTVDVTTGSAFLKDEAAVRSEWLKHLIHDKNAPLDVAFESTCKITKVLYPYACFNLECSAQWEATSYWEREEEYQVATEKTVWIDKSGIERDYRIDGVRPIRKTEYTTKTRTVVDNIENTHGAVGPATFAENIPLSHTYDTDITDEFFANSVIGDIDISTTTDAQIVPSTISWQEAFEDAQNISARKLVSMGKSDVPGTRFENFTLHNFDVMGYSSMPAYLSLYKVDFTYKGDSHICIVNGGDIDSGIYFESIPQDDTIKQTDDALQVLISKTGWWSRKLIFLIAAILFLCSGAPMLK